MYRGFFPSAVPVKADESCWLEKNWMWLSPCVTFSYPSYCFSCFPMLLLTFISLLCFHCLFCLSPVTKTHFVSLFPLRHTSMSPWASSGATSPLIDFSGIMKNEPHFPMAHLAELLSKRLLLYLQHIKKGARCS